VFKQTREELKATRAEAAAAKQRAEALERQMAEMAALHQGLKRVFVPEEPAEPDYLANDPLAREVVKPLQAKVSEAEKALQKLTEQHQQLAQWKEQQEQQAQIAALDREVTAALKAQGVPKSRETMAAVLDMMRYNAGVTAESAAKKMAEFLRGYADAEFQRRTAPQAPLSLHAEAKLPADTKLPKDSQGARALLRELL
jgi:DNA repair exonuclease SbcCD ATPase subunit